MKRVLFSLLCLLAGVAAAQGVHDHTLPEVRLLQDARQVTAPIPKGFDGRPDWVKALRFKQIEPRETRWGSPREPEPWGEAPKEGIVFTHTRYMPYVVFPHQPHVEWLACANCHDELFPRRKSGRLRGMVAIFQGETCGACHGRVAFSPEGSCYRCHSMPNPAAALQGSPFVEPTQPESAPVEEEERRGWLRGRKNAPLAPGLRPAPTVAP